MDLKVRTATFKAGNFKHLATNRGVYRMETITLDVALFNAAQYVDGYIPAGCALGKVTATSRYGPYDDTAVTGREVFAGLLGDRVPVPADNTTGLTVGPLQWEGHIIEAQLPFQSGQAGRGYIDAAGKTDGGANWRWV